MLKIVGPVGIRALSLLRDGTFGSPIRKLAWSRAGIETALWCKEGHAAPEKECSCGIYLPYDWQAAVENRGDKPPIFTLCAGLGIVIDEGTVYRCEQTAVLSIVDMDEKGNPLRGSRYNQILHAQRYFTDQDLMVIRLSDAEVMIDYQRSVFEENCKHILTVLEDYT